MDDARLSRKRATDRKSQQAFGERTKQKIATLEDRVKDLSQNVEDLNRQLETVTLQRNRLAESALG